MRNGIRRQLNGERRYVKMTSILPFEKLTAEQKRLRILGMPTKPATGPQVITDVYRLSAYELAELKRRGVVGPVKKIVEVTDSNGTVKVAIDPDGGIVDAEKKGLSPLQMGMIAVGAFLLFGG